MSTSTIVSETVDYQVGDIAYEGHFACPEGDGPFPCVLVIQEWWGINDYIIARTEQLARAGYAAFAVDMYGAGNRAANPDEAGALMNGAVETPGAIPERFNGGLDWVTQHPEVDGGRIAAIGYCFGGAVVLAMARGGADLAAVASFHGILATDSPAQPGAVKAKILVCHGNDDAMVPPEQVEAFKAEMDAAGADYEFVGYDDTLHGFTNPAATARGEAYGLPLAHNPLADEDSWNRMLGLMEKAFA